MPALRGVFVAGVALTGWALPFIAALWGAAIVSSSGVALAQGLVGIDGTYYPRGYGGLFVSYKPCRSYQVDAIETEKLYPEVGKVLKRFTRPAEVTASLQLSPTSPIGERSWYDVTSISPRVTGLHDAERLCTSSSPGGYYEGLLIGFNLARNGFGRVDLLLSGDREVLIGFTSDAPPLRVGRQVIGETRVRVFVDNIVDPDGNTSQKALRIEALP